MFASLVALALLNSPPCVPLELQAQVSPDLRRVRGALVCHRPEGAPEAVSVWNFPVVLGDGSELGELEQPWIYPEGFSAAGMTVTHLGAALPSKRVAPLRATAEGPVRLEFETRLPTRNGALGYRNGAAYMLSGWHPLLGEAEATPYVPREIRYEVRLPPGLRGLVGGRRITPDQRVVKGSFTGAYLPLLLAKALGGASLPTGVVLAPEAAPGGIRDMSTHRDQTALHHLVETLNEGVDAAAEMGLPPAPFLVTVAPLRGALVEPTEVGFAVSDRAFHLLDYEVFLKFHRVRVTEALFGYFARRLTANRERPGERASVSEWLRAALLERWVARRYGEREYAAALLEPFAVIPEIDTLLYAPRIPFRRTYFNAIYEESPVQESAYEFARQDLSGELLYQKLKDSVGQARAQALASRYLACDQPLLALLKEELDDDGLRYLNQFRTRYPRVDYRLDSVVSGVEGTTVLVEVAGPDAKEVLEPLTVEVTTRNGDTHNQTRIGPGELHFPEVKSPKQVVLDPRGRLVELHREPGKDPHFNNHQHPRWRLLLNNLSGLLSATGGDLVGNMDLGLRRLHDLRWRYRLSLRGGPAALGAGLSATYAFGRQLSPLWLAERVGASLRINYLREDPGGSEAGKEISAGLFYHYDTRESALSSFRGEGLLLSGSGSYSETTSGQTYTFSSLGAAGLRIWKLGLGQALVGRIRGDIQWGESPTQRGFRLGGRYLGLRGYEMTSPRGPRRGILSLEHRHALVMGRRTDVFGLFTVTQIEGALFGDVLYLGGEPARFGCDSTVFGDIGYGLRFLVDLLNVAPSALTVDVGIPLRRCGELKAISPVTVYVGFVQSFLAF